MAPKRLVQITDCHLSAAPGEPVRGMDPWQTLDAVLAHIRKGPRPDLLLVSGDLTQDLGEPVLRALRDRLTPLADRVLALPGNHDDPEALARVFPGSPVDTAATSHVLGEWQLLLMDTSRPGEAGGEMGGQRLEALEFLLGEGPVLCAGHHQPAPAGSAWLDAIGLRDGAALLARLARRPQVQGMLFGHVHQTFDRRYEGLRLLGTPATCFQFRPGRARFALDPGRRPGYRTVRLWPDGRLTSRVVRVPA